MSRHHFRSQALTMALALLPGVGHACGEAPALRGALSIPQCDPARQDEPCVPAAQALFEAIQALDIPEVFTVGLQTSPWRMYDTEGRILTVEELAVAVRAARPESDRRVHLVGSWTASRPDGGAETLARRLSAALDGFPVDGSDGFLWLTSAGGMRTTHQAASIWKTGPYLVAKGADVMMALVPGAQGQYAGQFDGMGMAEGLVQAGISHDVLLLCPEEALRWFKRAATMGSATGAYNAGLMHADEGDHDAAIPWLEMAAGLGEGKATQALERLHLQAP